MKWFLAPKHHSLSFILSLLLHKCLTLPQLHQLHAYTISSGLANDPFVAGNLIESFLRQESGNLSTAHVIFSLSPIQTTFMYNILIKAYASMNLPRAIMLYTQMTKSGVFANNYTFPPLIKACTQWQAVVSGETIHCQILRLGLQNDPFVHSAILNFYGICKGMHFAVALFAEVSKPSIVSWTSIVNGHAKSRDFAAARQVFDKMPERNLVSWNAMISGYVHNGQFQEALGLFNEMQLSMIKPNGAILVSVLVAVAELGALHQGRWVHDYIERNGLSYTANLSTSLVHMYAKCGDIETSSRVFNMFSNKSLDLFNAMINGFALHGLGKEALDLFAKMLAHDKLRPDDIAFLGVLSACARSGLVREGLDCFESMARLHGVEPKMEHYGCIVDLLGRAGHLNEALLLIENMPLEPDSRVWGPFLGACRIHGAVQLGETIGNLLIELEPSRPERYVTLSNIYAKGGRWREAERVREVMKNRGVKVEPGCSSIEVDGVVHEFLVGDEVNTNKAREVYLVLDVIAKHMREGIGCITNAMPVLLGGFEEG
ncbi:hypothetical protein AMTRI_Chr01g112570 [Amborella trichopoda]